MKKISIVLILMLVLSCSSEEKEATMNAMDKEMVAVDTNIHEIPAQSNTNKTHSDSLTQNQPILVDGDNKKRYRKTPILKENLPQILRKKIAFIWPMSGPLLFL